MPGSVCSVALCKSNAVTNKKIGDKVRFFTFPKDPSLRKEWVRRCFRTDNFDPENKRICSKHFKLEDYEDAIEAKITNRLPRILKRDCIPSLNLKGQEKQLIQANRTRFERAAKRKQREIIKKMLENEKMEKAELEEYENNVVYNDSSENGSDGQLERMEALKEIKCELDKKISDFISSKVLKNGAYPLHRG